MRINDVAESNAKIQGLNLNLEANREKATLSVLTDISETLALMLDLYAMVHGRTISRKEPDNADGQ